MRLRCAQGRGRQQYLLQKSPEYISAGLTGVFTSKSTTSGLTIHHQQLSTAVTTDNSSASVHAATAPSVQGVDSGVPTSAAEKSGGASAAAATQLSTGVAPGTSVPTSITTDDAEQPVIPTEPPAAPTALAEIGLDAAAFALLPQPVQRRLRMHLSRGHTREALKLIRKHSSNGTPVPVPAPVHASASPEPAVSAPVLLGRSSGAPTALVDARSAADALDALEHEWQAYNNTNLADAVRQKEAAERATTELESQLAAAESRAELANATLMRVVEGQRFAMRTAARLADAAKEARSLFRRGGAAASKILLDAANLGSELGLLPLECAADLSRAEELYAAVAAKFDMNEPQMLASYRYLIDAKRAYLMARDELRDPKAARREPVS